MPLYRPPVGDATLWLPSDYGYQTWTADPAGAVNNSTLTVGRLYLCKVKLPVAATISNLVVFIATLGTSLTSGQNFVGLFDAAGTLVGVTADQTTAWGATGAIVGALTSPYAAAPGSYYVALLSNGTTSPAFARSTSSTAQVHNGSVSAAAYRWGTTGSGLTAVPASFTPSGLANNSPAIWAAAA